jgi:hypothetical protein
MQGKIMVEVNRQDLEKQFGKKYGHYLASPMYNRIGGKLKQIKSHKGGNRYVSGIPSIRELVHYDIDKCIDAFNTMLANQPRTQKQVDNYTKAIKSLKIMKEL